MMTKEEIHNKANTVFKEVFKDDTLEIHEQMSAKDVEKWDSLNHLTLIATIEERFGIKFKLKELIAMKNVGDLLQIIASKTGAS